MSTPIVTYALIGITVLTSLAAFNNPKLREQLMFTPYLIKKRGEFARFLSSALIHGDYMHLGVNMFVLYMFGTNVEPSFNVLFGGMGSLAFLGLYILGAIASGIPSYLKHQNHSYYRALGASGATSAVLYASILMYPMMTLFIFPIPIPIPAVIFGILYLGYEYWAGRNRQSDGVGHDAHFWGAVFGVFFTLALKPELGANFVSEVSNGISGLLGG